MALDFGPYHADTEPSPVVETMLRVSVHAVLRAYRTKKVEVTWFDQQGKWIGLGNITRPHIDTIRIDYITDNRHYIE